MILGLAKILIQSAEASTALYRVSPIGTAGYARAEEMTQLRAVVRDYYDAWYRSLKSYRR
jgi:hypothetical protein